MPKEILDKPFMSSQITTDDNDKPVYSPCRYECPIHTDVQRYIHLISNAKYEEAFETIRSVNPLPSTCSYICHHPCENACRRGKIDAPLAIRHLKRYAIQKATEYRKKNRLRPKQTNGKKVAIIGSGPSGLTVASDLADLGYGVTIYEKFSKLGGILALAIPTYRLPREALKEDIDDILAKGVETVLNCEVGKDISLKDLIAKYDTVVVATGLMKSRNLNIPGIDGQGVLLAIPFLIDVFSNDNREFKLGKRVVVIGGGNVAIDVARTAKRLGSDVEMVCLEAPDEMPAWSWEVDEATQEDIKINHRWAPKEIVRKDGIIEGLVVKRVTSVFDSNGRFNPEYDEHITDFISADTVIVSIGQTVDTTFLNDSPLIVDKQGKLVFNNHDYLSNHPKIFYSGEIVTGPGSAVSAIAHGHKVASSIHQRLNDSKTDLSFVEIDKIGDIPETVRNVIKARPRISISLLDTNIRKKTFIPVEIGYDDASALREAKRCRGCGGGAVVDIRKCMACMTCKRICPYDAPVVSFYSRIRQEYCQACGLCVSTCPSKAISMRGMDVESFRKDVIGLLSEKNSNIQTPPFLLYTCITQGLNPEIPQDIKVVSLDCLSRLDVLDIITPFNYAIRGVLLLPCNDDCKYHGVDYWLKMKVLHAKKILSSLSIPQDCIQIIFNNKSELSQNINDSSLNALIQRHKEGLQ
ncbi:MAG: FAD-dependent oxidoreductase [Thermodesulfovibrionales bacterium]|nr:FAD-dependent oxidoreductase [Thermodesulfovibrionales bacterium]